MRRHCNAHLANAHGFTLIEFMIVIALIATATLAILGYKAVAKGDGDTAIETSNVAIIATKMPKLKAAGTYGKAKDDLLQPLIALGAIPSTMSVTNNTVTNAWGGAVKIVSTGAGYTISYEKLPTTACISMAMGMSGGSTDITTTINATKPVAGPVSAQDATAGCSVAANTILWTFAS
jgi:prepilin-type N-terminal cleavage/methylation domain-containing protein